MKINRERVLERYKKYADAYDASDIKIALKINHIYRVAGLSERIARSLHLGVESQSLAWLLGMLHDIGRFEQLRLYNTFNDAESVDHAAYACALLCGEANQDGAPDKIGSLRDFVEDVSEDALILTAIREHNAYRVREGLDERELTFCHILRDADKIDILRVNFDFPLEKIYNVSRESLYCAEVTEEVMHSFFQHHATLRSLKKTPVDNIVGHISLLFELVYPESLRIVKEQGYWEKLIDFPSENPKTRNQLKILKEEMKKYMEKHF